MASDITSLSDPRTVGWELVEDSGFLGHVGPIWTKEDERGLALAFLADEKHRNRRGIVQGGMIATLLDRGIGLAVRQVNGNRAQATVQLDIHYLDAARIGDFVEARFSIDKKTRSLVFASGTAHVGERPVASAKGIWKLLGEH